VRDDRTVPTNTDPRERTPARLWLRLIVILVIVATVVFGLALILMAATLGSCSAFGGTCPADRPPLIEDDTFGLAATGAFLIAAVPTYLTRPSWRRLGLGIGAGLCAGIIVGLVVRSIAHG
jgi:hypothetical protein